MSRKRPAGIDYWKGVPHSRIRHEVIDSPAWRVLGYPARALYTDLRSKVRSNNNGNITCTLAEMKHRGWRSSATLSKSLRELEWMGFLAKTREGGIASLSKWPTLYRFTDLPVHEFKNPPIPEQSETFDFRAFETVKDARAHLRDMPKPDKAKRSQKNEDSDTEATRFSKRTRAA